jgi:hypothetical protein
LLYDNLGSETPECILLYDKNNVMVHKITSRSCKPCTAVVRAESSFVEKNIGLIIGLGFVGFSVLGTFVYFKLIR